MRRNLVVVLLNVPLIVAAFAPSLTINNSYKRASSISNLNLSPSPQVDVSKPYNAQTIITCYKTIQSKPESESVQSQALFQGIREWLIPSANAASTTATATSKPPTAEEVKMLRDAFGALYGERNPSKAEALLSQAINAWERQPADERAGLYRVRGDCFAVRC